jgi:excisionase family DNA binding protein
MSDLKRWHSVDDIAAMLDVSRAKVYGLANARRIPHKKVGRSLRFTDEHVEQIKQIFDVPVVVDAPNVSGLSPRSRGRLRRAARQERAG